MFCIDHLRRVNTASLTILNRMNWAILFMPSFFSVISNDRLWLHVRGWSAGTSLGCLECLIGTSNSIWIADWHFLDSRILLQRVCLGDITRPFAIRRVSSSGDRRKVIVWRLYIRVLLIVALVMIITLLVMVVINVALGVPLIRSLVIHFIFIRSISLII